MSTTVDRRYGRIRSANDRLITAARRDVWATDLLLEDCDPQTEWICICEKKVTDDALLLCYLIGHSSRMSQLGTYFFCASFRVL